jgi:hypothetical protein
MNKEYNLRQIQDFLCDALNDDTVTADEIYDTILESISVIVEYHQSNYTKAQRAFDLIKDYVKPNPTVLEKDLYNDAIKEREYYEPSTPLWGHSDLEYGIHHKEDKVVKWQLPIEVSDDLEEYVINLPEDLLEAANLKEGDTVEWIDNGDGSYIMKKIIIHNTAGDLK